MCSTKFLAGVALLTLLVSCSDATPDAEDFAKEFAEVACDWGARCDVIESVAVPAGGIEDDATVDECRAVLRAYVEETYVGECQYQSDAARACLDAIPEPECADVTYPWWHPWGECEDAFFSDVGEPVFNHEITSGCHLLSD